MLLGFTDADGKCGLRFLEDTSGVCSSPAYGNVTAT